MARVAVVHNTLDFQGGADAVCLSVCEALQREHDVTLFTLSETSLETLARRFGVGLDVDGIDVRSPRGGSTTAKALSTAAPLLGPQLPLRSVLVRRSFELEADTFDLAVSTANEFDFSVPSVQYVHYPQFHADRVPDASGALNRLWSRLAGPDRGSFEDVTMLANSSWTADVFAGVYGVEPTVVHPPVDPIEPQADWDDREDGVVVVGRIAPDKRILDAVEVVDGVRERGHDVHLHVVGAAPRSYRQYADRVEAAAAERPYVTVERDVPRARLEELLGAHKYGLNLKPREHFGMSVAEYVAAGMIAFAPDSGGQREILGGRDDRLFGSVDEAIGLLGAAIERDQPPETPSDRFGRSRFRAAIRDHVDRALD
ncbi:glycosyltransferase family 4 protein [Halobellus rufus]|uniref:glycosyltransferase family 4 protein n=1 Tax=Halobellus rufus TaxID=1448860 RepID=UPI000678F197|nr:glycosyltransferase family 4 protein [Halobellus rufus]